MNPPPISFSLILEAANLNHDNWPMLEECLESLDEQNLHPSSAQEVLLMDPGHASPELLERIGASYPWVERVAVGDGFGYFQTKWAGVERCSGEVIVFGDSDNVFQPGWLRHLVEPFAEDGDIQILTGQTTTVVDDFYSTVYAISFFFPRVREGERLYPVETYFANNVAFRAKLLDQHPIPTDVPLLRGCDYVHSVRLRRRGVKVWRQPKSVVVHESPTNLRELWTRYLLRGADRINIWRLTRAADSSNGSLLPALAAARNALAVLVANIVEMLRWTADVARQEPQSRRYLPLALPTAVVLSGVALVGMGIALFDPDWVLKHYGLEHGGAPELA